jgi:hypothetical protein
MIYVSYQNALDQKRQEREGSHHLTILQVLLTLRLLKSAHRKQRRKQLIPLNNEAVGLPKEKNKSDNKKSKKSGKKKSEKEKERKEQSSIRERKRRNKSEPIGSLTKPEKRRRMRASGNQRQRNSALSGPDQSEPCGHCKWICGSDDDPKKDLPWIQCGKCASWFHESCAEEVGLLDDDVFLCGPCVWTKNLRP